MARTRIKICGVCRVEDAKLAVAAGADAIGMIRVPDAGRYIELETARAITAALPAFVTPVLVFMNTSVNEIQDDLTLFGYQRIVQLNGEESPEFITELGEVPVIKAVRMDGEARDRLVELREARLPNLLGVVLESPGQAGGSGKGNDWALVKSLKSEGLFDGLNIIAAGGLTAETVGEVVRDVRPYAVDVSSGVEEVKREKSTAKVTAFVDAVRKSDAR